MRFCQNRALEVLIRLAHALGADTIAVITTLIGVSVEERGMW